MAASGRLDSWVALALFNTRDTLVHTCDIHTYIDTPAQRVQIQIQIHTDIYYAHGHTAHMHMHIRTIYIGIIIVIIT